MKRMFLLSFLIMMAPAAMAETAAGTWLTGPDHKGQVGHVRLSPCGAALCGTIVRSFDRSGKKIQGPNDGKRVMWDVVPTSGATYTAKVYLPLYKATVNSKMTVQGNALTIRGCMGPVCQSQKWTRVN